MVTPAPNVTITASHYQSHARTHDRCGGYDPRSQFRRGPQACLLLLERNSARNSNCVAPEPCEGRSLAAFPHLSPALWRGLCQKGFAEAATTSLRPSPPSPARLANGRAVGKGADAAKKRKWKESEMFLHFKNKMAILQTLSKDIRI